MTDLDAKEVMLNRTKYGGMMAVVYLGYCMVTFIVGMMGFAVIAIRKDTPVGWYALSPVMWIGFSTAMHVFRSAWNIHSRMRTTRWTTDKPRLSDLKQPQKCSPCGAEY